MRICFRDLEISLQEAITPEPALVKKVESLAHASGVVSELVITRRILDVRRNRPRYLYVVECEVPEAIGLKALEKEIAFAPKSLMFSRFKLSQAPTGPSPVVVGAGPAGLLCALNLAEAGMQPLIIERGKDVKRRGKDISNLYGKGILDPESNVCFGEGGAGTYSDGKLYTRVNDPRFRRLLESFVQHGANPDILINNRPHIGTDKLVKLLNSIRAHLTDLGATFLFDTRVDDFTVENGQIQGVVTSTGDKIDSRNVFVATGHSARTVWENLENRGAQLECRPFSLGFRVEHPQPLINQIRYGHEAENELLPAADYKLVHNQKQGDARGVYSFCMCPGGVVVTTPTRPGALCINGMSHAARSGKYANSALVVTVTPEDFEKAGFTGTFAGTDFQEQIEQQAYEAGNGDFVAPGCRVTDFLDNKVSQDLPATSYRRGITPFPIQNLYPEPVITALKQGLTRFNGKMRGFITEEAKLIGVETRTASPVRVIRDHETRQAAGISGLYPMGEGMGYGGGIASAAIDGMRSADVCLESLGAQEEQIHSK